MILFILYYENMKKKYENVTEKINIKMYTEHKPDEIKKVCYPHLS